MGGIEDPADEGGASAHKRASFKKWRQAKGGNKKCAPVHNSVQYPWYERVFGTSGLLQGCLDTRHLVSVNCSHNGGMVSKHNGIWANSLNRRHALQAMAGFLAGSPLLRAQQDPFRDHSRVPGLNELVTAFDFEPVAYAKVQRFNYDYTAYGTDSEFTLRRNR